MNNSIDKRANFNLIRYANCWEDADILLEALNHKKNSNILSIGSSGDNSLSLLTSVPHTIIAIDINPSQIACIEIRKIIFKIFNHNEILSFLGVRGEKKKDRLKKYNEIKPLLPVESRIFWDKNINILKKGIIHFGKFEKYFKLFRLIVLPLLLNKKNQNELLKKKTKGQRLQFYEEKLNHFRYNFLFKIFFNKQTMGKLGRDPEFFKYVEGSIEKKIKTHTKHALTEIPTNNNPYLEYIIKGNFSTSVPHYLRKENYDLIKDNIDKLIIFKGTVHEALDKYKNLKFDGFNLSDIFEYMNETEFKNHLNHLINSSNKKARLVYWNMQVTRNSKFVNENRLRNLEELSKKLFFYDKAFFYKDFIIEEVK